MNTNTEFEISENSINLKNNDDITSDKIEYENENENENEKFRSAYHIACQWGSIKSLEFLLKLNFIFTIFSNILVFVFYGHNGIQF